SYVVSRNFAFAAGIALALAACGGKNDGGKAGGPQMPPMEVTVVVAQKGDAPVTYEASGRVVAYRTAEVRARVEGILEKRLFKEGGEVQEGQPLFRIDPRTLEANVASARAALAKARANADVAAQTVSRYRRLIADQAVSKQELDQAEAQLKLSEAEIANSEAALKRAEIDLNNSNVPAPISGRINRAFVTEGTFVGRGEATPLAKIEQLNPINVDFTQSGSDRLRLQKAFTEGDLKRARFPIELVLEDGSVYRYKGQLRIEEQTVDPTTGTVTLRAEFPNPDRLLLPGMFATVRFAPGMLSEAVKVPQRAVQASPQGQFVYVVTPDNKVAPQPIKTAGFSGQDWIVIDGLKGGERIVVDGLQKIRPGAVVNPVVAGAPPPQSPPTGQASATAAPTSPNSATDQAQAQPPAGSSGQASAPSNTAQRPSASAGGKPAVAAER
ncbi:MAG TPA: efflux RND transporter periplasmic adaptor subunit, partial [Candidatus Elarobacter sp.]